MGEHNGKLMAMLRVRATWNSISTGDGHDKFDTTLFDPSQRLESKA